MNEKQTSTPDFGRIYRTANISLLQRYEKTGNKIAFFKLHSLQQ
jgi:hypothetical protein